MGTQTIGSPLFRGGFILRERALVTGLGFSYYLGETFEPSNLSPDAELIVITDSNLNLLQYLGDELSERLALIIHPNSGYDNLLPFLQKTPHLPVVIGQKIRQEAVSEYVLSCLFHHFSELPFIKVWDQKRTWKRKLLRDTCIQIIGYGHVGRKLASTLVTITGQVFIYDPEEDKDDLKLDRADVLVLLPSLNASSWHLLDDSFLEKLSSKVCIIQPSRGEVVDELALAKFLKRNPQAFAYLDVFGKEPCDFRDLEHLNNIKMTSHVAGVHENLQADILSFVESELKNFLNSPRQFIEAFPDEH